MLYLSRESGQGIIEYALLLSMVALLLFALVAILGNQIIMTYDQIVDQILAI